MISLFIPVFSKSAEMALERKDTQPTSYFVTGRVYMYVYSHVNIHHSSLEERWEYNYG
jgi:hypothetical protein